VAVARIGLGWLSFVYPATLAYQPEISPPYTNTESVRGGQTPEVHGVVDVRVMWIEPLKL
jgi:hypothetical protein